MEFVKQVNLSSEVVTGIVVGGVVGTICFMSVWKMNYSRENIRAFAASSLTQANLYLSS